MFPTSGAGGGPGIFLEISRNVLSNLINSLNIKVIITTNNPIAKYAMNDNMSDHFRRKLALQFSYKNNEIIHYFAT